MEENKNLLHLTLRDGEWPFTGIDHNRQVVRAIVVDDAGDYYFVRVNRDDDFGKATLIETSGGGVEENEELCEAISRELKEELGVSADILCKIGVVEDDYNLIRRHNINHFFLCRVRAFGERQLTEMEREQFHLSTLKLNFAQAVAEYEACACTPLGRLIARREVPILHRAAELLAERNKEETP